MNQTFNKNEARFSFIFENKDQKSFLENICFQFSKLFLVRFNHITLESTYQRFKIKQNQF